MDWRHKKIILKKYWNGETTTDEERLLNGAFSKLQLLEEEREDAAYFNTLRRFSKLEVDLDWVDILQETKAPHRFISLRNTLFKIAAVVALILSIAVSIYQQQLPLNTTTVAQNQDPEKAFEMAKQSLLLISIQLNKGISYTSELDQFDHTLEKIKFSNTNQIK